MVEVIITRTEKPKKDSYIGETPSDVYYRKKKEELEKNNIPTNLTGSQNVSVTDKEGNIDLEAVNARREELAQQQQINQPKPKSTVQGIEKATVYTRPGDEGLYMKLEDYQALGQEKAKEKAKEDIIKNRLVAMPEAKPKETINVQKAQEQPQTQPTNQPAQKMFGGGSITAGKPRGFFDPVKSFIISGSRAFMGSEDTGQTLRTGTPEDTAGALAGVVGSIWAGSRIGTSKVTQKAVSATAPTAEIVAKTLMPGKTALKVTGGLVASDIALYPIAQANPEFKESFYNPYLQVQLGAGTLYAGGKVLKAGVAGVKSIPAVSSAISKVSATDMGKKAINIYSKTYTLPTGFKPGIVVAPVATALNLGVGVGTYYGTTGVLSLTAGRKESRESNEKIKELASEGYSRALGTYGGEEDYRQRLEKYYESGGMPKAEARDRANAIIGSSPENPYMTQTAQEKQDIESLKPKGGFFSTNTLFSGIYQYIDVGRIAQRQKEVFGMANPFYNEKVTGAELRAGYEYAESKGYSQAETNKLIKDIQKELNTRDVGLTASNLAINTYSEVLGQTLIYPKVFKQAEGQAIKSTLSGRFKLAYIGLNTAALGYAEGASTEATRQIAFGEKINPKKINEIGLYGLGSSVAIQSALFATTPIKAKETGKLQKGILIGSYVVDMPYELAGDIAAEKLVIPQIQKRFNVEFDRPVFVKGADTETIMFGVAKGKQTIVPRFRTMTSTNIMNQGKTETNILQDIDSKSKINAAQNKIQNNIINNINARTNINPFTQTPVQPTDDTPSKPNNKTGTNIFSQNYINTGTQTQTQANTFTNIVTSVPMFRIPPPMPLMLPTIGDSGMGGLTGKERKKYLNELEVGRNLINNLVGIKLYPKSNKPKSKKSSRKRK